MNTHEISDDLQVLYSAMEISSRISVPRPIAEHMYNSSSFGNRSGVVAWIRSVSSLVQNSHSHLYF